jgi:hypothetical protein
VCPGRQSIAIRDTPKTRAGSLRRKKEFAWRELNSQLNISASVRLSAFPRAANRAAKKRRPHLWEATMELVVRLNVLAALLSFGFIAAIVFGVI